MATRITTIQLTSTGISGIGFLSIAFASAFSGIFDSEYKGYFELDFGVHAPFIYFLLLNISVSFGIAMLIGGLRLVTRDWPHQ